MKNQIEQVIIGRSKELGGTQIRRILPFAKQRSVGHFVFLDHMGPATQTPDHEMTVLSHPHIGLSTLTYLFEGEILHRDSLGNEQMIRPREVNWMTAGNGIAHSERGQSHSAIVHGLQFWVALPKEFEDIDPSFIHYDQKDLPVINHADYQIRVIAGEYQGHRAKLKAYTDTIFFDIEAKATMQFSYQKEGHQTAAYIIEGQLKIGETIYEPGTMITFATSSPVDITTFANTRFVFLGGTPLAEPRFMWWNFVSSSQEKIEAAKIKWQAGKFAKVIHEDAVIPLPSN